MGGGELLERVPYFLHSKDREQMKHVGLEYQIKLEFLYEHFALEIFFLEKNLTFSCSNLSPFSKPISESLLQS